MTIAINDDQEIIEKTHSYMAGQSAVVAVERARLARVILDEILAYLKPGVTESAAREFCKNSFKAHGVTTWHAPYVRFGQHTLLTFKDKTAEDFVLQENDIAFVDIGIVKDGVEADIGQTIVVGDNPDFLLLKQASEKIFFEAEAFWHKHNAEGVALYEHIHQIAEKCGVVFSLDPAGHLIGAFPHRGWKKGLNHFPATVIPGTWILEIQVRHQHLPYGAFYEDLLLANNRSATY
jgi:Xaa-Pro aminopeptidase